MKYIHKSRRKVNHLHRFMGAVIMAVSFASVASYYQPLVSPIPAHASTINLRPIETVVSHIPTKETVQVAMCEMKVISKDLTILTKELEIKKKEGWFK